MSIGNVPEVLSQHILVEQIFGGRLAIALSLVVLLCVVGIFRCPLFRGPLYKLIYHYFSLTYITSLLNKAR